MIKGIIKFVIGTMIGTIIIVAFFSLISMDLKWVISEELSVVRFFIVLFSSALGIAYATDEDKAKANY